MLNIRGKAKPVPIPWIILPAIRIQNSVASVQAKVPAMKRSIAVRNSDLVRKRRFNNDDSGMMAVSTSR